MRSLLRSQKKQYSQNKEFLKYSRKDFEIIEDLLSGISQDLGFIISMLSYLKTTPYQEILINTVSVNLEDCEKEIYNSRYSKNKEEYTVNAVFFYTKFTTLITKTSLLLGIYELLTAHVIENGLDLDKLRGKDEDRIESKE